MFFKKLFSSNYLNDTEFKVSCNNFVVSDSISPKFKPFKLKITKCLRLNLSGTNGSIKFACSFFKHQIFSLYWRWRVIVVWKDFSYVVWKGVSYLGDDMTPYPPPVFQSEEADKLIMKSALIIEPKSYIQCRPLCRNLFEKSQ